jgi:hypothetical protein
MREILLTQGMVALVDDEDYGRVAHFKWHASRRKSTWYARRNVQLPSGRWTAEYMHRVVMRSGPEIHIDHTNGNGCDNQKSNLRTATQRENMRNSGKHAVAASRFKGVSWHRKSHKWHARINSGVIGSNGKAREVSLGYYDDEEAAAHAYNGAALASFGVFARLNFPVES